MIRLHSETVEAQDKGASPQSLQVHMERLAEDVIEFDLIGVDSAIANSIRRTMHADVPTLAVEAVLVSNNTSVIPDEVLAHRLGLVPLFCTLDKPPVPLVMTLRVINTGQQAMTVYAKDLTVRDVELRECVGIINPDIVLCRLASNQEMDMELHCIMGTGREHAKWSPVSTASYRLLPDIRILKPIVGQDATKFASCFTPGTVEVENGRAVVRAPRLDMVSRECLRHPEFEGKVELGRVNDHFIFNVEVIGQYTPRQVVEKSFEILINKCDALLVALD